MGWVSGQQLKPAGKYLLGILKSEGSVPFSRFYNQDTDYVSLAEEVAAYADDDKNAIDEEHVHILIEFAAYQLENTGAVAFTKLDARLIDDEEDYQITLTEKGRAMLEEEKQFHYRDMDL